MLVLNVFNKETSGKDTRLGDVHVPLNDIDFQNSERCWYDLADLVGTFVTFMFTALLLVRFFLQWEQLCDSY